jgi:hypothetical protein
MHIFRGQRLLRCNYLDGTIQLQLTAEVIALLCAGLVMTENNR